MTNKRCSLNRFTFAVVAQMARALDCRSRRCRFKSDPQRHLRSFWIRWAKRSCHLAFNQVIASSNLVRITIFPLGVAQSGQSTRFGTGKSSVRIGPPRPNSSGLAWLISDQLSADRHRFFFPVIAQTAMPPGLQPGNCEFESRPDHHFFSWV